MPDGSSALCRGAAPPDLMAESDPVVLRRLTARPKPRRTTLVFGVSQMILGLAIVAISFTAFGLSSSNRVRNACPYWAGFSVLLTGGVGLIAWKQPSSLALSFFTFLSAVCVVLHLVATALAGLSGADLQTMTGCRDDVRLWTCHCCASRTRCARVEDMVAFEGVRDCTIITSTIKDLMYSVCVTNIVACVICIAATIIGCAYIVKRHTMRRMIVRRSQCSNFARDSYFSDIIMPTDSVFTPPVAPPPPYSPPEYTAISNDRVLIESNEFMDDMSTPTPVIGPQDMPPPYSTLDLSPGGTIECAVAQEYQMDPSEIRRIEHQCLASQTTVRNSYNPGRAIIAVCRRTNSEQIPTPPLRWDSHHVGRINPITRMEQPGSNIVVEAHQHRHRHTSNLPAPILGVESNIRRTKSKSRARSGDSLRGSPQHARHTRQSLPPVIHRNGSESNGNYIIVDDAITVQSRIHANSGSCVPVVIMRPHRSRPPQGNRVSTASQTSLEETDNTATIGNIITNTETISVGDRVIPSIPCSVSCEATSRESHRSAQFRNANERTKYDNIVPTDNNPYAPEGNKGSNLMDRKPSSSSGSVSEPPTNVPSQNKSSSSNERLTTSTNGSRTSRDSASAAGRKHRRRHSHHAAERRRVSSSTTCSTSPTDASSRSSSSSFSRNRRRSRNRYISTSSSSDSENDQRFPVQRRIIVARMANGAVKHDMLDPNVCGYVGSDQHGHRFRKSSGSSSNTPPRGRPKHPKTGGEKARSGNRRTSSSGPSTKLDTKMQQNIPETTIDQSKTVHPTAITTPDTSEQTNIRQKRPNSLNLRLGRKSHPIAQPRQGQQATVKFAENDPWVHKDTGRTYASVGVQSMPEQSPTIHVASTKQKNPSKFPSAANPPQTISSAPTPYTNTDPSAVPKPKPRPKSMVELSQDTSVIVASFLRQSIPGLSPAIKTVLEDIQSVITTDEQYLAEVLQSQSIVDEFMEKSSSREKIPESKIGTDRKLPRTKTTPLNASPLGSKEPLDKTPHEKPRSEDTDILPIAKTKLRDSPDSNLISEANQDALLQECLAKTLLSARETVL